jgi:drug/metabolite transporter (DMT)-like permease
MRLYMHITSGRWAYGLFLALLTALLWGVLPIKLKIVLQAMDPVTVTWFRLVGAGGVLFIYLSLTRRLPAFRPLGRRGIGLVGLAVVGLVANYVLYLFALQLISAGTAQLMIQVGPIFLILCSLYVFKERFNLAQCIGMVVLLGGFGLFFNQRIGELLGSMGTYTTGVLLVLLAAAVWTFYAMSQKQLLNHWNSLQVMMVIYLGCALVITPWAHPWEALSLSPLQGWLLLACCLNTLIAYGAFAEALAHWQASRVSATLALTPLVTFASAAIGSSLWPDLVHGEDANGLAYFGALVVVAGSAMVALGPTLMASWRTRQTGAESPQAS